MKMIPVLLDKLSTYLTELGLPNAQFKFNFQTTEHFKNNGTDQLTVLFTANKGISFGPLKKIASGGELNRIMLAIKAVLAQYKQLPTLIFDEIDSGISGSIALKMATILSEMSKTMQMICITHQAQIAAKGSTHIKVFKEDIDERTVTLLRTLDDNERIGEIAEMLGGKDRSESAMIHAKELLN
jgi:DNA repair protein RecN (Recombination protein N)